MEMNQIAVAIGRAFADTEIQELKAFEDYARELGDNPTYEKYESLRLAFIAGYVEVRPNAKGDAADQAFKRFLNRLCASIHIAVPTKPKSSNPNAIKKQREREAKKETLLEKYEGDDLAALRDMLSVAYERQAKDPMTKNKDIGELETVIKERMKDTVKNTKEALREIKKDLRQAITDCNDATLLTKALDLFQ